MSTLIELSAAGEVELFVPELGFRQQALRLIYLRPGVMEWIEGNLPDAESDCGSELSPLEQLDELLNTFCAGEALIHERQVKILHQHRHCVWELKTADVRLFGWFPKVDVFVWTATNLKRIIRDHGLVPGYVQQAVNFRNQLNLDPPKFIPGADPNGVATNIS